MESWGAGLWWLWTILLLLFGGIIGETIGRPLFSRMRNVLLNVATLGARWIKNSVYREAAKPNQQRLTILLLFGLNLLLIAASYEVIFRSHEINIRLQQQRAAEHQTETKQGVLTDKQVALMHFLVGIIVSLGGLFSTMRYLQLSYANAALTHFHHVLTIVRPFISESEALTIQANFACITTAEEYQEVIDTLYAVARHHQLPIPPFTIW